ncbi:hypothetical protein GCM10025868_25680 [Angustibacter aerolatus]|uniref:UspA domain-containing protein n=1 Tax=Angustibacter aerolatus TaxID=1162965 RepID=A0ABQ6JIT6_9ACTN|nr:amino acid transporter [Angustibacter aerolatus]GMA87318.1 hypothetical protein GCM10025868_25680 [Angustibacter aerolatus]
MSVAGIAVGWGGNFNSFLDSVFGVSLPTAISSPPEDGGVVNVPAVVITLLVTLLLVRGTRESATVNLIMVGVKIVVLLFFIVVAFTHFKSGNLKPFNPEGSSGITAAAGVIFFAYIGFDAVSTASEESKRPARDLPIAIIGSLLISTLFYVAVALGATGLVPYKNLAGSEAPLADALKQAAGLDWAAGVLSLGALIAITSVLLVILYGQTRIFFAMCRDGLMPKSLATVSPRFGTPARLTLIFGVLVAVLSAFVPLSEIVKPGQHRHAVRVRAGEHRRDRAAAHPAGHGTPVQDAAGAGVPDHRLPALLLPDEGPAGHHLDPVRRVAGHRPGDLLPLLAQALPAADRSGRRVHREAPRDADQGGLMPGTVVVGYEGGGPGEDVLAFGRRWAERTGDRLVVVTVHPGQAMGIARGDAEWVAYERTEAKALLDEARREPGRRRGGVPAGRRVLPSPRPARRGRRADPRDRDAGARRPPRPRAAPHVPGVDRAADAAGRAGAGDAGARPLPARPDRRTRPGVRRLRRHQRRPGRPRLGRRDRRPAGHRPRRAVGRARHVGRGQHRLRPRVRQRPAPRLRAVAGRRRRRPAPGLDAAGRLLDGPVVDALVEITPEQTDLLVVGSRGYGPLASVLLGGVSSRVVRNARVPVTVVPRGRR